jgi:hypothetical protein
LMVATSADGIIWSPIVEKPPVLPHDHDINNIFHDPVRNHYVATISTIQQGNWSGKRRITRQSFSDDLIHWSKAWNVLVPDEMDEGETQFYAMAGYLNRGDLLIGLVKVLRDELHADPDETGHGIGYTTLAYSRDGVHWMRDRERFMDRDPNKGVWDHAHCWGDCQLIIGDEVYIYYGGYQRGHKTERFTQRQLGLAKLPRDRYVARHAGGEEGSLRTKLLDIDASRLTVNANVRGEMKLRMVDASGGEVAPLEELALMGDSLKHPIKWALTAAKGKSVRLEFQLRDADLYAISVE